MIQLDNFHSFFWTGLDGLSPERLKVDPRWNPFCSIEEYLDLLDSRYAKCSAFL